MKFCWTTIEVKDLEESLNFYENIVGLKVDNRIDASEDRAMVFLGEGETVVYL